MQYPHQSHQAPAEKTIKLDTQGGECNGLNKKKTKIQAVNCTWLVSSSVSSSASSLSKVSSIDSDIISIWKMDNRTWKAYIITTCIIEWKHNTNEGRKDALQWCSQNSIQWPYVKLFLQRKWVGISCAVWTGSKI